MRPVEGFSAAAAGPADVEMRLAGLLTELAADRETGIGFPGATDIDWTPLRPFLDYLINNVGDPFGDSTNRCHNKVMERELLDLLADLFDAPPDDRWGYVTSGGTESNLYALRLARNAHPDGLVYYSTAAHYSVPKAVEVLGLDGCPVRATGRGEIDYADLRDRLEENAGRPSVVVANIGTTMTEAVDDVTEIRRTLARARAHRTFLHADAALSGIPLAVLGHPKAPSLREVDSVAISGHKFLGTPMPCGVLLTRRSVVDRPARRIQYVGVVDSTLSGSRNGHAVLHLWYALTTLRLAGLRARACRAVELARHLVVRLERAGWPAWAHPHACTVVLAQPPPEVLARWPLASSDGWSHVVCSPGVRPEQLDALVEDIARTADRADGRPVAGVHPARG